jgi:hypothetical protein
MKADRYVMKQAYAAAERIENVYCMFVLTDHDNMAAAPCCHVFDFVKRATTDPSGRVV